MTENEGERAGYREVLATLADRISEGWYEREGRTGWLPSQSQLGAEFGIGATSLRIVLAILEDRGVIRGHRGKGYYVVGSRADPEHQRNVNGTPDSGTPNGHGAT